MQKYRRETDYKASPDAVRVVPSIRRVGQLLSLEKRLNAPGCRGERLLPESMYSLASRRAPEEFRFVGYP